MRSAHDFKRQTNLLEKAEKNGYTVLRGEVDPARNRMGISLVIMKHQSKGDDGGLLSDEIFGPVLPIIPIDVSPPLDHGWDV